MVSIKIKNNSTQLILKIKKDITTLFKHSTYVVTSNRFKPITIAKKEAATGSPCPICPYAFPANAAAMPSSASVVANPRANAIESPTTCPRG